MEIWKEVKGYEGSYQVSNLGRVRSLDRLDSAGRRLSGKVRKIGLSGCGYLIVSLCLDGKHKHPKVHQLVAGAFLNHTPCGHKLVVDHIDNDKLNNKLENLQIITSRENNSKDKIGCTSNYTGVYVTRSGMFASKIGIGIDVHYLGSYKSEEEASEAYKKSLEDYNNGCFEARKYSEYKPSSKYKYISWNKARSKWKVNVYITKEKTIYGGYFNCEEEAHSKVIEILNKKI